MSATRIESSYLVRRTAKWPPSHRESKLTRACARARANTHADVHDGRLGTRDAPGNERMRACALRARVHATHRACNARGDDLMYPLWPIRFSSRFFFAYHIRTRMRSRNRYLFGKTGRKRARERPASIRTRARVHAQNSVHVPSDAKKELAKRRHA